MILSSENCGVPKVEIDSFADRAMDIHLASQIARALSEAIGRTSSGDTYHAVRCPLSRSEEQTVVDALRLLSHRIGHGLRSALEPLATIESFLIRFDLLLAVEQWEALSRRVRDRQPGVQSSPS